MKTKFRIDMICPKCKKRCFGERAVNGDKWYWRRVDEGGKTHTCKSK